MKKLSLIALAIISIVSSSCDEETQPLASDDTINVSSVAYDVNTETVSASSFENVDLITDEGVEEVFKMASISGKMTKGPRIACADIAHDSVNNVITIDFGAGCEDQRGIVRSGTIKISYTDRPRVPGASRIITFENFYLDSIQIAGVYTMTNATDVANTTGVAVMETKLEGGKLTFPDGSTISREANHTRTLFRGETLGNGYTTLTGNASGTLQDGTTYTMTILENIMTTRSCIVKVPVLGVKEFVAGENTISINFGDGTCDNLVEITRNGVTETIELSGRAGMKGGRDNHNRKDGRNG